MTPIICDAGVQLPEFIMATTLEDQQAEIKRMQHENALANYWKRDSVRLSDLVYRMYEAAGQIEGGDELEAVKRCAADRDDLRRQLAEATGIMVDFLDVLDNAHDELETSTMRRFVEKHAADTPARTPEREAWPRMTKKTIDGLYRKFNVSRTDGKDGPGQKHENCEYFVLDMNHDPHAIPAIKAYAHSCRHTHFFLASDLIQKYVPEEVFDSDDETADRIRSVIRNLQQRNAELEQQLASVQPMSPEEYQRLTETCALECFRSLNVQSVCDVIRKHFPRESIPAYPQVSEPAGERFEGFIDMRNNTPQNGQFSTTKISYIDVPCTLYVRREKGE